MLDVVGRIALILALALLCGIAGLWLPDGVLTGLPGGGGVSARAQAFWAFALGQAFGFVVGVVVASLIEAPWGSAMGGGRRSLIAAVLVALALGVPLIAAMP